MAELYHLSQYVLEALRENRMDKNTGLCLMQKLNEREDIAIIGMGLKYANTERYQDYWELLREKRTVVERCPQTRRALVSGAEKEEAFCKGALIQDIEMFDPEAFSMTQEEAAALHPAHRMMLQAVYRALEDSGYLGEKNSENRMGVYIGKHSDKEHIFPNQDSIASKVAQVFDLHGGACAIEAGSPSSAIAIENACRAILSKQYSTAIAGGVLVELAPLKQKAASMFCHDDSVLTRGFDNDPGGVYLAEGAGAVLLKPLAQALEDGDRIHGVICGHAWNSSGAGKRSEAIETLVLEAAKSAQIDMKDVDYLELAGSAEKDGQGMELAGLIAGLRRLTDRTQFCGLGTLSGSMGDLQAATGVFQLIKLCLAMQHKTLPPQYRFHEPTDAVNLLQSPFYVSDYAKPWRADDGKPRHAAILASGSGGNNVMLLLQEAPEAKERGKGRKAELFVLSGATKEAFRTRIGDMIAYLSDAKESLTDICYTADVCRPAYRQYRLAVLCRSKEQLAQSLEEYLKKDKAPLNMFVGQCKEGESERVSVDGFTMEEVATGFSEGAEYYFDELFEGVQTATVALPPYPFDKQRCWPDTAKQKRTKK